MALKDLGEKGIVDPYPPLVDIKGELRKSYLTVRIFVLSLFSSRSSDHNCRLLHCPV